MSTYERDVCLQPRRQKLKQGAFRFQLYFSSPGLFHTIPPVRPVLLKPLNLGKASIPTLSTPTRWIHVETALHPAEVRRRRSFALCCLARSSTKCPTEACFGDLA